jgi:hypothetical protein
MYLNFKKILYKTKEEKKAELVEHYLKMRRLLKQDDIITKKIR